MKNKQKIPLVSVIVTTRNEEKNIRTCLASVKQQSYKNIELLVVDNNSTDKTKNISSEYTDSVINKGPERSVQRNFGSKAAHGEYLLFLDADMRLSKDVVRKCIEEIKRVDVGGLVIPEESYGIGYWAACKKLERSFYVGNSFIEAARFFKKYAFEKVGGFDTSLTGPEDWDLSQKVKDKFGLGRTKSYIYHNEGKLSLVKTISKKYYYSKKIFLYSKKTRNKSYTKNQMGVVYRYKIFFSQPKKMLASPLVSVGMLFMKTLEFTAGLFGYIITK